MSRPKSLFGAIAATAFGLLLAIGFASATDAQPTSSPVAAASIRPAAGPVTMGCGALPRQTSLASGVLVPITTFDIDLAPH